jgi:hypothetical protein
MMNLKMALVKEMQTDYSAQEVTPIISMEKNGPRV